MRQKSRACRLAPHADESQAASAAERRPHVQRGSEASRQRADQRAIRILLAACDSPAQALELCYWSKEPGLIEIVRALALMPDEARSAIEVFVALARNAASIEAELDARGVLSLVSVEATRTAALAQFAATEETESAPPLLN